MSTNVKALYRQAGVFLPHLRDATKADTDEQGVGRVGRRGFLFVQDVGSYNNNRWRGDNFLVQCVATDRLYVNKILVRGTSNARPRNRGDYLTQLPPELRFSTVRPKSRGLFSGYPQKLTLSIAHRSTRPCMGERPLSPRKPFSLNSTFGSD